MTKSGVLLAAALAAAAAWGSEIKVEVIPRAISPGEVALIRIFPGAGAALPAGLLVAAGDKAIPLWECPKAKEARCGLVPTPMEARKSFPIQVTWSEGTKAFSDTTSVSLVEKKYPQTKLKVLPGKVNPDPEEQKRIDREREEFRVLYESPSPQPFWNEKFIAPTTVHVTSAFGSQRVFNGEVKTVHYGVDLRAGPKNPIVSANAGKVVYAKEAFYGGNMVIVDHGLGIYSSYSHLSAIQVTVGQIVKRGEKLGMAGSSGRVTGPHLHWAVRVHGLSVDPLQMKKTFGRMWDASKKRGRVAGGSANG
jgi:murein DD-endopeptidase MepM/ murein hydrolase activator NlpD